MEKHILYNHTVTYKLFKSYYFILLLTLCFSCNSIYRKDKSVKNEHWINLLEKNNIEDWVIKIKGHPAGSNYNDTFIVDNNILKVDYTAYKDTFNNTFGHIYYKKPFTNYKLKLDYRFLGNQVADGESWAYKNSGVMIHSENPYKIDLNQEFPVSIEVQLLGGDGKTERSTANVCTPGTHIKTNNELVTKHCLNSKSKTYFDNHWVHLEIEVYSDSLIRHYINGSKVMEYTKPFFGGEYSSTSSLLKEGKAVKSGYIALQSESHPIHFKNIKLLELD